MNKAAEEFRKLCEDNRTNFQRSPWAQQQGSKGWIHLITLEVEEVLNAPTTENLAEELGDVLWNTISTILALQKEGGPPLEDVLEAIRVKIRHRKPWIFDGSELTLTPDEENLLWEQMKRRSR
jgi:NTP pyrophosphatase (non-canonical NTP hydrolase)